MDKTFINFNIGKNFLVTDRIDRVRKDKRPYFIFLDKSKIAKYFHFSDILSQSGRRCYFLHPNKKGIDEVTGKDGSYYVLYVEKEELGDIKEYPFLSEVLDIYNNQDYIILTEESPGKNRVIKTERLLCRIFYNNALESTYPVSYSPFTSSSTHIDNPTQIEPLLSFGYDHAFTLAYLEMGEILSSANLGNLSGFYEIEEMDRLVNRIMGHLQLKDITLLRDYNNYSLISNYLRRFDHVEKINHIHSHLTVTMADNGKASENGIGIIYDSISNGPGSVLQGSQILYGRPGTFKVMGSWKPVPLPGGDIANIEPWRISLAILKEALGGDFTELDLPLIKKLNENESITYLIDAINRGNIRYTMSASMHNILSALGELLWYKEATFDMDFFESLLDESDVAKMDDHYPLGITKSEDEYLVETYDLFKNVVTELFSGKDLSFLISKSINSIARVTGDMVEKVSKDTGEKKVFLSGEFFKYETFLSIIYNELKERGFDVYYNKKTPVDDSAVSVGQILYYYYCRLNHSQN